MENPSRQGCLTWPSRRKCSIRLTWPDTFRSVRCTAFPETVIAEKMHAIIDLADQSSRMKDYYDIYHLLTSFQYDTAILQDAINRTFENRHTPYTKDTMFFREDFPNHPQMQVRWTAFLKKATINDTLSFPEVACWLQDTLRLYWTAYGLCCKNR